MLSSWVCGCVGVWVLSQSVSQSVSQSESVREADWEALPYVVVCFRPSNNDFKINQRQI